MSEEEIADAFSQALKLEQGGEWEQAIRMYEQLARQLAGRQESVYANNSIARLRKMRRAGSTVPAVIEGEGLRQVRWVLLPTLCAA
jgi:hypothetical protein